MIERSLFPKLFTGCPNQPVRENSVLPDRDAMTVKKHFNCHRRLTRAKRTMCTFGGVLTEYPWISVDSFVQTNCQASQVFFVSHM